MKEMKKDIFKLFGMVSLLFCLSLVFGMHSYAADDMVPINKWDDLKKDIEGLSTTESRTYCINSNLDATSQIEVKNKHITITCNKKVTIKRAEGFTTDFFYIDNNSLVRIKGYNNNSRLVFDGANIPVGGSFAGVRGGSTFYVDQYVTVQDFYSTQDAGAIYNVANTVLYSGSTFKGCTTDGRGNAVFNCGSAVLTIDGCDISGAKNDKADIFQEGTLKFVAAKKGGTVAAKIEKGIDIAVENRTSINSNFKLIDSRYPIRIDASIDPYKVLFTVGSTVNGSGASSVRSCFKAGNGYSDSQELYRDGNAFCKAYILNKPNIDYKTSVNTGGYNETIILPEDKDYYVYLTAGKNNSKAIVTSMKWTCSDTKSIGFEKINDTKYKIYAKKYTGASKPVLITYTIGNNEHTAVSTTIKVIVEKQPVITMDQMRVGSQTRLKAPIYSDRYGYVAYRWMESIDGGRTWHEAKNGTGNKTSCFTTEKLESKAENWRYKCEVVLSDLYEDDYTVTLTSNIISFSSLNKEIPTIRLSDKKAAYTGKQIKIDEAIVSPRSLLGYVDYVYYTDVLCTKKTTSKNGASKVGGPPKNAGTYYVVANLRETERYRAEQYMFAKLEIVKSKGDIATKSNNIKVTMGTTPTIVPLARNLGNPKFTLKVSKPKYLLAEVKNGKIVCKGLKPGKCKVTVNTVGNNNVTAASTSFNVTVRPEKIKLAKVYIGKDKKVNLRFKPLKYITDYDVQVSSKSNFKDLEVFEKGVNFKNIAWKNRKKKSQFKIGELNKKTTYYIRIRAYNGKNKKKRIYGPWSEVKKVKTK